ncbi:hypothetical protein SmJEL517_g05385 [Synchytrium microbalum]|uniref:Glutathione transferase n=1 Tax=Synchytrium microbalum TaxID=1806994 RepID=A0A507BPF0_9FUNG|nr:uncharacterized protein SmJEL517_g05385 [Synchytrium microbalum]TPX31247.1 hypothetical protein SmJEL517_g05385 [Synchytrium microbalum]
MPPKASGSKDKTKAKMVEDKTFGLKNKNKSAKMAKYVAQVETAVMAAGNRKAVDAQAAEKAARAAKKADEEKRKAELAELFKPVQTQQKVPFGVDPKTILCAFFKASQCQKGDKCKFSHDPNIDRKEAKIDVYTDKRKDEKDEDTMDKWDQEKLNAVVNQKHSSGNVNKPTEIVCKFFVDAIEAGKYGWFWECPNGGDKCKYRHALPMGYILKKKETEEERREREEMEKENEISIEEFLDTERHQLGQNLTPINEVSFAKWKADKKTREATDAAALSKKKEEAYKQHKAGMKSGILFSGKELFDFNPDWKDADDDEAVALDMREESDGERPADEEGRAGNGYLGEDNGVESDEHDDEDDDTATSSKHKGKQKASDDTEAAIDVSMFEAEDLAGIDDDDDEEEEEADEERKLNLEDKTNRKRNKTYQTALRNMSVTLYHAPTSPFGNKLKIIMYEKGIDFALPPLSETPANIFLANPRSEVPLLKHGDVVLFDSRVIAEYLEEVFPDKPMWPKNPALKAKGRVIADVVDTHLEGITWGIGEITFFNRTPPGSKLREEMLEKATSQIQDYFTFLSTQLTGMDYFGGDVFSISDAAVASHVMGCVARGILPPAGSNLARWWAVVEQRPSVAKVIEGGVADRSGPTITDAATRIEQGLFKREYRDHRLEWMIKSNPAGIDIVKAGIGKNIRFIDEKNFARCGKM